MTTPKRHRERQRQIRSLGFAVLFASFSGLAESESLFDDDALKISLWNYSAEVRGSFGYKDNVALAHTNTQASPLWESGAELMVFRLPTHGWQFSFYADASDVRYLDSPSVDNEQLALAAARLSKDFGNGWKSTVGLNYLFQNQVFDFSDAYTSQASVGQILGHTLVPRWDLRKTIGAFWLQGELSGTRQWLDEPLDDYWQYGPRLTGGYGWGRESELTLAYEYSRLAYDTREQLDRLGGVLTNTALVMNSHLVELSLTHTWDEQRRWQTITSLSYEAILDNGSGFYDYNNYRFSQKVRFRNELWEATVRARLSHSEYSSQTVSPADAALRRKTLFNLTLRAERKLLKHLKVYASYEWDRSISNLDFDDYAANTVTGGLALMF